MINRILLRNKIIFFPVLILFTVSLHASYSMTELEATSLDVPDVVNTVNWDNTDTGYPDDDDKQTVAIGFPFQFDNTLYNDVTILTNGLLKFGAIERMHRDYRNESLDSDEGDRFIAVYWDDLVDDASSSVTYGMSGSSPDRKFIVNWTNVRAYSNNLRYDFQVVLYENGDIRYRYNNNTSNGQSATIGLEINDSDFIQYSYNQVSVEVSFDLLFRNSLLALPSPIAQYRLDEESWDSTSGEVIDSSGSGLNGTAQNGADSSDVSPALGSTIGTCRYGEFNGTDEYVNIPDNALLDLSGSFAVGVWIKISSIPTSGLKTIVSKDENYEFHVNSAGQINWWWQLSGGATQQFNSTGVITPGVWTHVVISYSDSNQRIFINGQLSGNATFTGAVMNNSDPLQIASDQGSGGRFFNGDIDEVNVFDTSLLQIQVVELMNETRPCSSFNLCVSSFPDGLNSHTAGSLTFERDVQLFFSPDDVLNAGSISLNGSSTQRSCVSVECQADGFGVDPTTAQAFPDTTTNTIDETVSNNNTGSIGSSENQYDDVTLGNSSTLNVNAGYSDYYIDSFNASNNVVLNLVPGTYWINNFSTGSNFNIAVSGGGTARIYINNTFTMGRDAVINSPSAGTQGDASQIFLHGYGDINIERDATFSGVIYAVGDITLGRDSNYYGAITGGDISVGRDSNIFFNPSAAANLDYGDLCQSASCTLGSFDIAQPSYALACPGTRSEISIQAMCDDGVSVKDDYAGTVNLSTTQNALSEFYESLVSSPVITSTVFDGTELGVKKVYLFHKNENPTLQVIANDSAVPVTTTSSNATDFRTSGFSVTAPNSFTCGGSTAVTLTAIGEDDTGASCQTLTGFNGSKKIHAWYSVNTDADVTAEAVSTGLSIEGQNITDQVEPSSDNINLTFNNGIATASLAYLNAGQILGVQFKHKEFPYDGSVPELSELTASTTSFIAKPDRIALSVLTANSVCTSQDATCSKFVSAGTEFSMKAEAQCSTGSVATDYQGSINFSSNLVAPALGKPGGLSVNNIIISEADSGSVTITDQAVSEVGVFDLLSESSSYYTETVGTFTLENIGRFYPHEFVMTAQSTTESCGGFSYMDQPGIKINYTLEARNTSGIRTDNYTGGFAKATTSLAAEDNNDGGFYDARLTASSAGSAIWNNGSYAFDEDYRFTRAATLDGPYPDLQIGVRLDDNDDNDSVIASLDMKSDTSSNCSVLGDCDAKLIDTIDARFGQLKLSNAFGPETLPLLMNVQTEYFDGTRFVLNDDDNCTGLVVTAPTFVAQQWNGNLAVGDTDPTLISDINSGEGIIQFRAPGIGNDGSVVYEYVSESWLETENTGDGSFDDGPLGTITFGQFRGNDRMIYWRELVR